LKLQANPWRNYRALARGNQTVEWDWQLSFGNRTDTHFARHAVDIRDFLKVESGFAFVRPDSGS
jgi:hypothetical protein